MSFITDRTAADVEKAKSVISKIKDDGWENLSEDKQAEYLNGLHGCYNILTDILRIEQEVERLNNTLYALGYTRGCDVKTDWQQGDFFDNVNVMRYLSNVEKLRGSFNMKPNTPPVPDSFKPYNKANDIEKILQDADELITKMPAAFIPCGTRVCGQTGELL